MATRLKKAIKDSGLSVREVARRMAGVKVWGEAAEGEKRKLYKWMDDTFPKPDEAARAAKVLGVEPATFLPSEQEKLQREESRMAEKLKEKQERLRQFEEAEAEGEALERELEQQPGASDEGSQSQPGAT